MKQLCMYLKHYDMQGQKMMVSGDFLQIPEWVNYWIRSGVSPLILLAGCVYPQKRGDATLADPNFYYAAMDGLRSMADGSWGRVLIDPSTLEEPVADFIAKCNRFM